MLCPLSSSRDDTEETGCEREIVLLLWRVNERHAYYCCTCMCNDVAAAGCCAGMLNLGFLWVGRDYRGGDKNRGARRHCVPTAACCLLCLLGQVEPHTYIHAQRGHNDGCSIDFEDVGCHGSSAPAVPLGTAMQHGVRAASSVSLQQQGFDSAIGPGTALVQRYCYHHCNRCLPTNERDAFTNHCPYGRRKATRWCISDDDDDDDGSRASRGGYRGDR